MTCQLSVSLLQSHRRTGYDSPTSSAMCSWWFKFASAQVAPCFSLPRQVQRGIRRHSFLPGLLSPSCPLPPTTLEVPPHFPWGAYKGYCVSQKLGQCPCVWNVSHFSAEQEGVCPSSVWVTGLLLSIAGPNRRLPFYLHFTWPVDKQRLSISRNPIVLTFLSFFCKL